MADDQKPDYADTLEAQLLVDYVSGGTTFIDACRTLNLHRQTIYSRMDASERFREMMEKARADGYDVIANECLAIADTAAEDIVETDRGPRLNKEHIQRSKLRVETRLKLLAKWHPQRYGEKLQVEQKTATVTIPVSDDPIAAQRAYEDLMKS